MNDWIDLQDQFPCFDQVYDVLLPDGTVIESVMSDEIEDEDGFGCNAGFKKYPEATHFRKSKRS